MPGHWIFEHDLIVFEELRKPEIGWDAFRLESVLDALKSIDAIAEPDPKRPPWSRSTVGFTEMPTNGLTPAQPKGVRH